MTTFHATVARCVNSTPARIYICGQFEFAATNLPDAVRSAASITRNIHHSITFVYRAPLPNEPVPTFDTLRN